MGRAISGAGRGSGGFTLIEITVVLFIVALLYGFALLRLGDDRRADRLDREGQRLGALIELAAEAAILGGRPFGLALEAGGYRIVEYRAGRWQPSDADPLFGRHAWPRDIAARALVDDGSPVFLFLPTGERVGEALVLFDAGSDLQLTLDAGQIGRPALPQVHGG
jgi:type II secretion system protein H